jgi:hypothetical protein
VVDSTLDRQLAEARVNNVFGAMSVSNELEVVRSK